jgi:hypothetical protein
MAKIMFDGTQGILSGEWDGEAITRQVEEQRRLDAEADKYAAETQSVCDQIDAFVNRFLADDLAAEMARIRLTQQQKKDFAELRISGCRDAD